MADFEHLNPDFLRGRKVCATGRLVSMTHAELAQLVQTCGGSYVPTPPRGSCLLVVGEGSWPSEVDGTVSRVFDRARRMKAYGYAVELLAENDFLERVGLGESASAIRGLHTLSDLSAVLKIPTARLRRWISAGLIKPSEVHCHLPYFNFRQVAFIKSLIELIEGGASLASIRRGIEQTQDLLPQGEAICDFWTNVERDGRVLLRLRERLVDQTGQKYFDFEPSGGGDATLYADGMEQGVHDLCDEALALEDDGCLIEAATTYQRALQVQPDHPTLHFDLGNVQFQLGDFDLAVASFLRATQLDANYAVAWHNLGSVYAQQAKWDDAEAALNRALDLVPTYADSHFTLAQVLSHQGRSSEAAVHEQAYHAHSKANCLRATRETHLRVISVDNEERLPGRDVVRQEVDAD